MLKAVIDIGTNTTHLLIADVDDQKTPPIKVILKKRVYTYLGAYGLEMIHEIPLKKLYVGLDLFLDLIQLHKVEKVKVVATEALRTASNGKDILKYIKCNYKWKPEIINGLTEAGWIAKGSMQAVDMTIGNYVVMDIGGGSVEFIYVNNGDILTKISTPLGISRLFDKYNAEDPILPSKIIELKKEIPNHLSAFKKRINHNRDRLTLIGTAGSFELFLKTENLKNDKILSKTVSLDKISNELERLIPTNIVEREADPTIPKNRSKYILVALLIIDAVISYLNIDEVIISKYALKEGAILAID